MRFFTSIFFIFPLTLLALVSPFVFSKSVTLTLAVISGFYIPALPIFIGATIDVLYYPGNTLPLGVTVGSIIFLITYGVRYFVRTRIM
jgi:hypothetical protein